MVIQLVPQYFIKTEDIQIYLLLFQQEMEHVCSNVTIIVHWKTKAEVYKWLTGDIVIIMVQYCMTHVFIY